MPRERNNREMIQEVAVGFRDLLPDIVFIGGSVLEFYADHPASTDIRPTFDIDCVIETASLGSYYNLEKRLRLLGFTNDTTQGAPICRWLYHGIIVDIMPTDSAILGFGNRWYKAGIQNRQTLKLPDSTRIQLFPVEYFVATKIDALLGRGGADLRISHDFEDIVYILDNCSTFKHSLKSCSDLKLKEFLKAFFQQLSLNKNLEEAIQCCLPPNSSYDNINAIIQLIRDLSILE